MESPPLPHKTKNTDPIHKENGNPLQCSCLENPMDCSLPGSSVHGFARVGHDLVTKPPPPPPYIKEAEIVKKRGMLHYHNRTETQDEDRGTIYQPTKNHDSVNFHVFSTIGV